MDKASLIRAIQDHADEIKSRGARSVYLFGSVLDDRAGPGSDVDLFVDYDEGFSLFDLVGLRHFLSDRLGITADVTTRDGLHPIISTKVQANAEQVI